MARWDEDDNTVQGWKDNLQQLIDDMDVAPDDYTIKNKFMVGLPITIRNGVFADKLSVEYNDLEELYQSTLDVEYALKAEQRFMRPTRAPHPVMEDKHSAPQENCPTKGRRLTFAKPNTPYMSMPTAKISAMNGPDNKVGAPLMAGKTIPSRHLKPDQKGGPGNDRRPTERICFRCGQPGHIASNPICLEHGKKLTYDQLRAAHTIIMDVMSDTVGAEEHPQADSDPEGCEVPNDEMEYKFYVVSDDADSIGDDSNPPHSEHLHHMAEDEEDLNSPPTGSEELSDGSEDIVMYGHPTLLSERVETIPLFQFGGAILSNVIKYSLAVRMAGTLATQPDCEEMAAMTEIQGELQ